MERKSERDGAGRNREGSVDGGKREEERQKEKGRHCRRETWGQGVGTEVVRQDKRWRVTCRASGEIQGPGKAEPPGQMEQREWRVALLEFRIGLVATCP